jgi:hypothetical protein
MSKKKKNEPQPLSGEALLKKVKQLEHLSKEEKARECGYFSISPSGAERINMLKFQNALLAASGFKLDERGGGTRGGRSASYRISVQANGNLLIGSAYTKKMNLHAGDEFIITLGRKNIHLRQVTDGVEHEEDEFEEEFYDKDTEEFDDMDDEIEDDEE